MALAMNRPSTMVVMRGMTSQILCLCQQAMKVVDDRDDDRELTPVDGQRCFE